MRAAGFTAMLDERILGQIDLNTRIDLRDALGRITAPTLVLASADDQILPPHHQRELAAGIQRAEYVELAGGHGLPLEAPERFFSVIVEYLDRRQAEAGVTAG
jgi:pimeloyl-ACP methyl ester carboxylesterase